MGFYANLEKKWYKFVEGLDKKGIPIRAITDPIEGMGLPSLPVFVGVLLVLIAAVAFVLVPAPGATLSITVTSNGDAVEGAQIAALFGDTELSASTDADGKAELRLPLDKEVEISAEKEGCAPSTETLSLTADDTLGMTLVCKTSPAFAGCLSAAETLAEATLAAPGGAYPRSCSITVKNRDLTAADLGWSVSGKKIYLSYDESNCPAEGQRVAIACSGYEYSATMERFVQDVQDDAQVMLVESSDDYEDTTASVVYTATVKILTEGGLPISGIRVTAADANGNPLTFSYSNIMLQSTTGSDGIVTLVIPGNVNYYVKAEDTGTAYAPKSSSSYLANSDKNVELRLVKGFSTTITVLDASDNTPIENAYIDLYDAGTQVAYGYSDEDGKAVFKLEKIDYTAKVSLTNFMPAEVTLTGGTTSAQALLTPLDDTNSGFLEVTVRNKHGVGEGLKDVIVKLSQGDTEIKSAVTSTDGVASFGRILAGSYTLTSDEEGSDTVSVSIVAGETTETAIDVVPAQVKLKVLTKVEGDPTKGVNVELFDITYSTRFPESLGSQLSGNNRIAEFSYDKGSRVYVKASFMSPTTGEQFGPVISEPFDLNYTTTEYTIDVSGVKNNVQMAMLDSDKNAYTGALEEGGNYYAELDMGLPFYDPQKREPYATAYIEFYTGGIGDLEDIQATPILIREVKQNDFIVENPAIGALTTADSYVYNRTIFQDSTGSSKYFRIDIAGYSAATTYRILVPIHVRSNVESDNSEVSYRAFWVTQDGVQFATNGGLWTHVPVTINTKTSGWRFLDSHPYFYLYDAWLSTDRAGTNKVGTWDIGSFDNAYTFAEGSTFYLQFRGKAKVPSNSYYVDLSTMPQDGYPYAVPISYSGSIVRTNGITQEIFPVTSVGDPTRISPTTASQGSDYSLDADDELRLAIRMKVQLNEQGGISDMYSAQTLQLADFGRQALLFNIRDLKPAEETPITNIVATELVGSFIYSEPRLYDHTTEVVPSYTVPEYGNTTGKTFGALINFENADPQIDKSLTLVVQDEHRTKGNQQPWAKLYKQVLPVYIGGEIEGFAQMDPRQGDNVFLAEKQGYIWGTTLATSCSNLTITPSYQNCYVSDNQLMFDYIPTTVGWQNITASMQVPTFDPANPVKTFTDSIEVYVADLPEMSVAAVVSPGTVNEGSNVEIQTTISNLDDKNTVTILNYSSPYGESAGNNSLEPRAYIWIDGTAFEQFGFIPPIAPLTSDTSVKFSWNASGSGPKNATVCAGYWKYDGTAWNLIPRTARCDSTAFFVTPKTETKFQDLGIELALNFTSKYKDEAAALNITATVTNYNQTSATPAAYTIRPVYWVTDEYGFKVAGQNMVGEIDPLANNSSATVSANYGLAELQYGKYQLVACAYYYYAMAIPGYPNYYAQDTDGHANCRSAGFELMARPPAPGPYPGEPPFFEQPPAVPGEIPTGSIINVRELVLNGQYDDALKQILLISRIDAPKEEKLEYSWALPANGSDWTVFVGKGVLAAGESNILDEASNLEVYLFESDAERAGMKPWAQGSFKHGWVDYDLALRGYDSKGTARLDMYTQVLSADIIRKDAENPAGKKLGIEATYTSSLKANGTAVAHILNNNGGYTDDEDPANLVIPYSNERGSYVRYLPEAMQNTLKAGNMTVYAVGPRFVVSKEFPIGGVEVTDTGTVFNFFAGTGTVKNSVITVRNYWQTPVAIGEISWNPDFVAPVYNLLVTKDGSWNEFDVPQSDASSIKPSGYAKLTVTSAPGSACYGNATGWLEIPIGQDEPYRIRFTMMCPAAPATMQGSQAVVRESANPATINTGGTRGCAITPLGTSRDRVAVCDAEQFAMAMLRDAAAGKVSAVYALGSESLTADTIEHVRAAYGYSDIHDVFLGAAGDDTGAKQLRVANEGIGCGRVVANFETIAGSDGGDVKVTFTTVGTTAAWCNGSYAQGLGYMNYDSALRASYPGGVKHAAFRSSGGFGLGAFLVDMQKAIDHGYINIGLQDLFGYAGDTADYITSEYNNEYADADYSIDYRDYFKGEIEGNADWAWLNTTITSTSKVRGYFNIVDGPGYAGKTLRLGLATYDDYRESEAELSRYRQQLAVELVKYLSNGTTTTINGNSQKSWGITPIGAPAADAGTNIFVDLSTNAMVTLDGSASTDRDGTIEEYIWSVKRGAVAEAEEYAEAANVKVDYSAAASGKLQLKSTTAAPYVKHFVDLPTAGTYSVSANGWGVKVDGQTFTSGSLSEGRHTVEITNTTINTVVDTITFVPTGAGEEITSADATTTYNVPGPGTYTVTLKVRDNDGLETTNTTGIKIYATESAGSDIQIGEATIEKSAVFDVSVPVSNEGGSGGSAVVSLFTTTSDPATYGCADILAGGAGITFVRAMPTGALGPGEDAVVELQNSDNNPYLVAVVSGSGAKTVSCDKSISSKWVDYASKSMAGAGVWIGTTAGTNNYSIDGDYVSNTYDSCTTTATAGCSITIDLGKNVTGLQQVDTYPYEANCEVYSGYLLQLSSNKNDWETVVDKSRFSGTQHDTFEPKTARYIRYQFKAGGIVAGSSTMLLKAPLVEVDAYTEQTGRPETEGTCGDVCHDTDGDGYGIDLNNGACLGEDPDETNPCIPDDSECQVGGEEAEWLWADEFNTINTGMWETLTATYDLYTAVSGIDGATGGVAECQGTKVNGCYMRVKTPYTSGTVEFRARWTNVDAAGAPWMGFIGADNKYHLFYDVENTATGAPAACLSTINKVAAANYVGTGGAAAMTCTAVTVGESDWHTYKISYGPTTTYYYVDGTQVASAGTIAGSKYLAMYEQIPTSDRHTNFQVDWVRYSASTTP